MKVISRTEAMKIKAANPGSRRLRYDSGKYRWTGSVKDYVGREVEYNIPGILAIYPQCQADADGKYVRLHCIKGN